MVVHKGDRQLRHPGSQGIVEQSAHVVLAAAAGGLIHALVQGHVEQAGRPVNLLQITQRHLHVPGPVFAYGGQALAGLLPYGLEPPGEEGEVDVLHRVQAEPVHSGLPGVPYPPAHQLLEDLGGANVHIGAHQVIVVHVFPVHRRVPLLARHPEYAAGLGALVPVGAGKAPVVPLKGGIALLAAGESEFHPGVDFPGRADLPGPVLRVHRHHHHRLGLVRAHAVVEHHVGEHLNAPGLKRPHAGDVIGLGAVLGAHRALLVEFPQVVQVVGTVPHVPRAVGPLVGRGQPYLGDPQVLKPTGRSGQPPP